METPLPTERTDSSEQMKEALRAEAHLQQSLQQAFRRYDESAVNETSFSYIPAENIFDRSDHTGESVTTVTRRPTIETGTDERPVDHEYTIQTSDLNGRLSMRASRMGAVWTPSTRNSSNTEDQPASAVLLKALSTRIGHGTSFDPTTQIVYRGNVVPKRSIKGMGFVAVKAWTQFWA
ncbi:MAG TPA: hypothetical protein VMR45_04035 [Patescibacteria group bacterium]|nr:hypothetical protein [Patescibacteria group bacterium]